MATAGEPLWIRSLETGREILNYDEYLKEFPVENYYGRLRRRPVEASRDSGIVFLDLPRIVQSFSDVVCDICIKLNYILSLIIYLRDCKQNFVMIDSNNAIYLIKI